MKYADIYVYSIDVYALKQNINWNCLFTFQIRDHIIRIVNLNIYKESFQFKTHAADIVREEREREEKRIQKKREEARDNTFRLKILSDRENTKVLSMSKHLLIHMLKTGVQELVKAVTNHCNLHVFVVKDFVS